MSCLVMTAACCAQADRSSFKFDFGSGKVKPGYTQVLPTTIYTGKLGYGFHRGSVVSAVDRGGDNALRSDFCTGDSPFFFSVDVPQGNFRVTVTLGDKASESTTTVKAESRRLMLEKVRTAPGEFAVRTFTVNVRNSRIEGGGEVRLKDREIGVYHWDDRLTLEFNDTRPCICAVEITRVDDAVTVYLAGDSTVTDQTREPWNSWGQMLTRFFKPEVAIANHAESGETLRAFVGERRLAKVLSRIKDGDYLFIQFAHNDMKQGSPEKVGYRKSLRHFINEARSRGATPVLVTSMHRRRFDENGQVVNTLQDFPEAMRSTAEQENVPLIDLHAMSEVFYEALGPEDSRKAFQDGTHHNSYGSYELARCVVEGIRRNKLGIAKYLVDDVPPFDPNRPDSPDTFDIPASPARGPDDMSDLKLPADLKPLFDYPVRDTSVCLGGDGVYYLTGTTGSPDWWAVTSDIQLWKSSDLKRWTPVVTGPRERTIVWNVDRQGCAWAKRIPLRDAAPFRPIWAPEIHYIKGTFWLTYCLPFNGAGILRSTTARPEGPYVSPLSEDAPLTREIDASLFEDDDGRVYFVCGNGKIALMKEDMSGLAEPLRAVSPANARRVGSEGAFLFKANGKYYMAAAEFVEGDYHCYVACSDNIYGPYGDRYIAIPHGGHNSFFRDTEGSWWATFFGNDRNAPFRQRPAVLRIEFTPDGRIRPLLP